MSPSDAEGEPGTVSPPVARVGRLLRPRSIAIIGASPTQGSLGASVLGNLERFEYDGDLHLVNPKHDTIGSRRCVQRIEDLPSDIDVAVLAIPRAAVLETLCALILRRIGSVVIFAAGFSEGGDAGSAQQRELKRLADAHGVLVVGPNCLGLVNYVDRVPLTFVEAAPPVAQSRHGVAIVSQSGAMAVVLSVMLASRRIGLTYTVSTGNEAVSGVEDYLEYLLDHAETSVFALIVEQFRQPRRFLEIAERAAARGKTLVLLHPGRSQAARESAATHTGAIAGDYAVMLTQVTQRQVLVADNLQQFGDLVELACRCGMPQRPGIAVVTESGAFKALTLDLCEQVGIALPVLDDHNAPALRAVVPAFVPVSNPVDLTAQGLVDADIYRRAIAALMPDERFGTLVLGIIQTDETTSAAKFPTIIQALRDLPRSLAVIFAGLDEGAPVPAGYIEQLRALDVPYFAAPDRAFIALARLQRTHTTGRVPVEPLHLAQRPAPGVIPEYRAKQMLGALGIAFAPGQLVASIEDAVRAARALHGPVALKAQSAELSHKSDAGGVVLNLSGDAQVAEGWQRLHRSLAQHRPGLVLDGVLVESMAGKGVELIIGARNDPEWGPTLLAGLGGVDAEIRRDFVLLPGGLPQDEVVRRLLQLRGAALLTGYRGSPVLDVEAVAVTLVRLGALLLGEPSIAEIDLNPVICYPKGQGILALDALMRVRGTGA